MVLTAGLRHAQVPPGVLAAGGPAPGRRSACWSGGPDDHGAAAGTGRLHRSGGGPGRLPGRVRDPNAKVTHPAFPAGATRPGYVAKVPTTDAAARQRGTRGERWLDDRRRGLPGRCSATIPQVVAPRAPRQARAGHDRDARAVDARGVPLAGGTRPGRRRWPPTSPPPDGWLAGLHGAAAGSGHASLAQLLDGAPTRSDAGSADEPDVDADLADLAGLRGRLAGHRTLRSVVHGDFWPGNLLIERRPRARGVIDWESARLAGTPARDLARFVITYSLYLDRHTRPGAEWPVTLDCGPLAGAPGVEYAINGTGWYPDLVRAS